MVITPPIFLEKDGFEKITGGLPIAEMLEVCLVSGGKKYRKIHGYVRSYSNAGLVYMFHRSRLNPQILQRNEELELTGPTCAITAFDNINIELNLMEGRNKRTQVLCDVAPWSPFCDTKDFVYSGIFEGFRCEIQVSMAVYFHGLIATTAITFKPTRPLPGIYGVITASNNMFPDYESTLFRKKKGDPLRVFEHEEEVELPLLRSVTALPLSRIPLQDFARKEDLEAGIIPKRTIDGALLLNVNLMSSHDDQAIARRKLKYFPVENYGEYISTISSHYGQIQVRVFFDDE